jgi:hypothetical protein
MNMEIGAQLDRSNAEFFAGQDIRKIQSVGAEQRLATAVSGEQERATRLAAGEQERKTNLQQEMFRRYKENRDYEQAQSQYRT